MPFSTVIFHRAHVPLGPRVPSMTYDVHLAAGRENYAVEVPISQAVPSGQADFIKLKISSDAWASFDAQVEMNSADGSVIQLGNLHLEYFASGQNIKLDHKHFRRLDLHLTATLLKYIRYVAENPLNNKDVVVVVTPEYSRDLFGGRAALEADLVELLRKTRDEATMCIVPEVGENDWNDCYDERGFHN